MYGLIDGKCYSIHLTVKEYVRIQSKIQWYLLVGSLFQHIGEEEEYK